MRLLDVTWHQNAAIHLRCRIWSGKKPSGSGPWHGLL